jgi:hypothetical protein
MSYLAIVDRGYRGSAEAQFFDALYGILVLGGQLGGVDLVLRGSAVTAAISEPSRVPVLRVGSLTVTTLPDHRKSIAAMIAMGTRVYVDQPGLAACGLGPEALLPGVQCIDTTALTAEWSAHDGVWFL